MDCFYVFASLSDRLEFACGKTMFLHRVSFCSRGGGAVGGWLGGGSLSQHAQQVTWPGVSVQGGPLSGGLSVWRRGVSVQGGLCPGGSLLGRPPIR